MSKNYAGVEDLLCDESFLSWYFKTDLRAIQQWEQWIAANPDNFDRIGQAVEFLQSVRLEERTLSPEQITGAESLLLERIRHAQSRDAKTVHPAILQNNDPHTTAVRLPQRRWWIAAASVLLLAGLGIGYLFRARSSELRTAYGEIRSNKLPDGTEVMVNADSRLTYSTQQDAAEKPLRSAYRSFRYHRPRHAVQCRQPAGQDQYHAQRGERAPAYRRG